MAVLVVVGVRVLVGLEVGTGVNVALASGGLGRKVCDGVEVTVASTIDGALFAKKEQASRKNITGMSLACAQKHSGDFH